MNQQLTRTAKSEPNPYRPDLPDSIREVSPELYQYLEELTRTLRSQHDITQAGDSTFSWELMTQVDLRPKYTLGSTGRFYHPKFGLIQGRYLRFESMIETEWLGSPIGLIADADEFGWVGTNDISKSDPDLVIGLGAFYVAPPAGAFGWVLTNGPNLQTARIHLGGIPEFGKLVWAASGLLGSETSYPGVVIASALAEVGEDPEVQLPPGSVFVKSESTAQSELLAALEERFAQLENGLNDLSDRFSSIEIPDTGDLSGQIVSLEDRIKTFDNRQSASERALARRMNQMNRRIFDPSPIFDAKFAEIRARFDTEMDVRERLYSAFEERFNGFDEAVSKLTLFNNRNTAGIGNLSTQIGSIRLTDLGGASQASIRQANRDIDTIYETLARLNSDWWRNRELIRDAGIYIDPDNGRVKIYAVEQTENLISDVQVNLSALESTINLKASVTYVNNAIAAAALDPSGLPIFTELEVRISEAEINIDGLAGEISNIGTVLNISGLEASIVNVESSISALEATVTTKAEVTELDAIDTRVTAAEVQLSAFDAPSITQTVRTARLVDEEGMDLQEQALFDIANREVLKNRVVEQVGQVQTQIITKINSDLSVEAGARTEMGAQILTRINDVNNYLNGQLVTVRADLINESATRVDQFSSLSITTTGLQNQFDAQTSYVNTQLASLVTQVNAAATSVTNLETDIDGQIATINTSLLTVSGVANAAAGAVTTLQATVNGLSGEVVTFSEVIGSVETDVANLTSGLSGVQSNVTGLSNDVTAVEGQVGTIATQVTDLRSRWGVRVTSGNRISGIVLNNSGTEAGFEVIADVFKIWPTSGGTGRAPFEYRDGVLRVGEILVDRVAVQTGQLAAMAAVELPANTAFDNLPDDYGQINSSAATILTYTLPTLPTGTVGVIIFVTGIMTSTQDGNIVWCELQRDGVLISGESKVMGNTGRGAIQFTYPDISPVAGRIYRIAMTSGRNLVVNNLRIFAQFIYR